MKRFLLALVSIGLVTMSVNASYAADKYLCKSGSNSSIYIQGMTKEQYCANAKYVGDSYYKNCMDKAFPAVQELYLSGKCKKYQQRIHDNNLGNARCIVEITDDPADGYIINCMGPEAAKFKPIVEKMYKK